MNIVYGLLEFIVIDIITHHFLVAWTYVCKRTIQGQKKNKK